MSASSPRRKTAPRNKTADRRVRESRRETDGVSTPRAARGPTAASSSSAVDEWVASVLEEKPVRYIIQNLERTYGVPVNKWTGWDVLDMLVSVILSQATSDANSDRTYDALKKRFPTWDAVLRAREQTLADTIRLGGLANQKAAVIRGLLHQIKERHASLALSFLPDCPSPEAARYRPH